MCQMNIDAYQAEMNKYFNTNYKMPIVFFTQLIGLAFGFPAEKVGFGAEIVSTRTALSKIGVEVPVEQGLTIPKNKSEGLPMPRRWSKQEVKKEALK